MDQMKIESIKQESAFPISGPKGMEKSGKGLTKLEYIAIEIFRDLVIKNKKSWFKKRSEDAIYKEAVSHAEKLLISLNK